MPTMLLAINIFTLTLSFFAGVCLALVAEFLPAYNPQVLLFMLLATIACVWRQRYLRLVAVCLLVMLLGLSYINWHVARFNAQQIPQDLEGKKLLVVGRVTEVVRKKSSQLLTLQLSRITDNRQVLALQSTIKVTCYKSAVNPVPGQTWSLLVKLKLPRNYANPGSFDLEKFMFAARVHALGYIVPGGEAKLISTNFSPLDYIQILRLRVASLLDAQDYRYGGILKALTLGINILPYEQKLIFQNTGLAHLLAISGLHIGLVAALLYKILQRITPKYNLRIYGMLVGALAYGALSGLAIPSQRALIMLAVVGLAKILVRNVSSFNTLALALLLVLLHDPLCILSVGFWLSFSAVLAILYFSSGRRKPGLLKFNLLITLAMLPLSLLFFSKVALIAPISNFFFVPLVTMVLVPIGLLAVLLSFIHQGLALGLFAKLNQLLAVCWPLLTKLSSVPVYELTISEAQYFNLIVASLGIIYVIYPAKLRFKPLALVCCLPLLLYRPVEIANGEVKFTQLDVGQGASSVIQTSNHTIIYDTGPKSFGFDAGSQVLVPFLKHQHIKQVDVLFISHADNDHIGGTAALMASLPVKKLVAGERDKLEAYALTLCTRGQAWVFDEVVFEVMHPEQSNLGKKRNDKSCVLKITTKSQKTLLITGDIEKKSEKQILALYDNSALATDVLIVPHHGSKTSSSDVFVARLQPKIAIFPTGYKNRYGHPKLQIIRKYQAINAQIFDTSNTGALSIITSEQPLKISCYRWQHKKFWRR